MKEHGFNMQRLVLLPNPELEQQALARASKAGEAAARSDNHISKTRKANPPNGRHLRARVKRRTAELPERTD